MPVFFDEPVDLTTYATYQEPSLLDLTSLIGMPEYAGLALFYYRYPSGTSGKKWGVADRWYPDPESLASPFVVTAIINTKFFFSMPLGPDGENPENKVWVYYDSSVIEIYCVGYLTYDEVVIFPEIMSEDRDNDYLMRNGVEVGGWGPYDTSATSTIDENIWNIPNMRILDGRQPTALLFHGTYDQFPVHPSEVSPKKDEASAYNNNTYTCGVAGFSANGDVTLYKNTNYNGTDYNWALAGYITTPITWYVMANNILRLTPFWIEDEYSTYTEPDPRAGTLILTNKSSKLGWGIYPDDPSISDTIPYAPDGVTGNYSNRDILVDVSQTSGTIGLRTKEDFVINTQGANMDSIIHGFIHKMYVERPESIEFDDLGVTSPELLYPPDNVGSLHMDCSVQAAEHAYTTIGDLKLYLSGSTSNSDPLLSIGGDKSSVELTSGLNSLFDDGTAVDSYVGASEYRCLYLMNDSGTQDAVGIKLWITKSNTDNQIDIGGDPAGVDGIAPLHTSTDVVPDGVDFIVSSAEATCYTVPILEVGQYIAVWFRRTFSNKSATKSTPDVVTLNASVLNNG